MPTAVSTPASRLVPTGPLVLQPDGEVLVVGKEFGGGLMARFDSNGELDSTFGNGGVAILLTGASQLALLSNGQILVSSGQVGVEPYNASGSVDGAFGILGEAASVASASTLTVQTNRVILAAGQSITGLATPTAFTGNPTGFGIVRFNSNGSIDTAFGSRGGVIAGFPHINLGGIAAIGLQTNGDIVAARQAGFQPNNLSQFTSSFALARYLSNGQLDSTFGTGRPRHYEFRQLQCGFHFRYGDSDRRQNCGGGNERRCCRQLRGGEVSVTVTASVFPSRTNLLRIRPLEKPRLVPRRFPVGIGSRGQPAGS
jgi:uncharacterized delta-60 repeat protein